MLDLCFLLIIVLAENASIIGTEIMSETSAGTSGPNEELAKLIISNLEDANLINPARREEILVKLGNGNASENDWIKCLDLPIKGNEVQRD